MKGIFKNRETVELLKARWNTLPDALKLPNQVVGRYWVQCGYTLGPSYCSFGCSHCYLPTNANRVPLVSLVEMKAQVDANRKMQGKGGHIQLTGGDLVDAYMRAGKEDELVEIVAYCVEKDLVPMLMTHGQGLLDNPSFLVRLVQEGGLRKLSCHIDITQAGRPGYPVKEMKNEKQLNPLRDELVDLIIKTRRQTGKNLVAAQTITVAAANIQGISDILQWLISRPENMEITRTISFQTEATVGRTLDHPNRVTPEQVWEQICKVVGMALPRDHLIYGHPDCNSSVTIIARSKDRKLINISNKSEESRQCWQSFLEVFSGLEVNGSQPIRNNIKKAMLFFRHPGLLVDIFRFLKTLWTSGELTLGMLVSLINGQAKGFNIVMHNFMGEEQMADKNDKVVQERLAACSFQGAVQKDGKWVAVPMCEMNTRIRPEIYQEKVRDQKMKSQ